MNRRFYRTVLALAMLALCATGVKAQTQLLRQVIGSGATAAIGGQNAIAGTIGQTIIGRSTSSSNIGYLGFWYTYPNPNNPNSVREEYTSAVTGATASLRVAPNPAVDVASVTITLPTSGTIDLALYDGIGQRRLQLVDGFREAGTLTLQIPAREFESGDYLLVLLAAGTRSASPLRIIK
jgi:hypothetical protein